MPDSEDTSGAGYTARLETLESAGWKRLLDVQAPYRWNLRRLLGGRRVLDVGCGIGRNLRSLAPGSVGVDHNTASVDVCRARGLRAFPTSEFWASPEAVPDYDGLLAAHLVEHLGRDDAREVLAPYLELLRPGARVVLICPQERGYRSDATHVRFHDHAELAELCHDLGLEVARQLSFPFPRVAGRLFTYNEFVTVALRSA